MSISVLAPFSSASERTSRVLFQPFDIAKWVRLGFCAWLAQFGDGGGGGFHVELPAPCPRVPGTGSRPMPTR